MDAIFLVKGIVEQVDRILFEEKLENSLQSLFLGI